MKRTLRADELRLWSHVAASVRPSGAGVQSPHGPAPRPGVQEFAEALEALGSAVAAPPVRPPPPLRPEAPAGAGGLPAVPAGRRIRPPPGPGRTPPADPQPIEPSRKRRIVSGRDPIESRLDLHGMDQDRARTALHAFLHRAHAAGFRAVLVITGKGALGDGVLRRRVPEWLGEPQVRALIAGVSAADRRHGGAGAVYLALKRRPGRPGG